MPDVPRHLLADISAEEVDKLLVEWRWLLGDDKRALFLTASGDVFLTSNAGPIFWLETGAGACTQVAATLPEFESALADPEKRKEWFLEPVVETLLRGKEPLEAGQCYTYTFLPVLGGEYQGENRFPLNAREHLGLTGELHHKIKDLPDGTKVKIDWVD